MKLLSVTEAADRLHVSPALIRRYCQRGLLGQKAGATWAIGEDELAAFAAVPRKRGRPAGEPRKEHHDGNH